MKKLILCEIPLSELEESFTKIVEAIVTTALSKSENNSSHKQENYITRKEAAKMLRITLPTLRQHTKLGILKQYNAGGRVLYKYDEIKDTIEKGILQKYRRER